MLLLGIIFILIGYFLLFSVPSDATFERMLLQAIAGMGMCFVGAVLCMIYIYKPKIADRNLFSGDFVIPSLPLRRPSHKLRASAQGNV
jgi:hypothetical protein